MSLDQRTDFLKKRIDTLSGSHSVHRQNHINQKNTIKKLEKDYETIYQAHEILKVLVSDRKDFISKGLERLNTEAVQAIWGRDDWFVKINVEGTRGTLYAEVQLETPEGTVNAQSGVGMSVREVISVVSRAACLMLQGGFQRPALILDEPFGRVDRYKIGGLTTAQRGVEFLKQITYKKNMETAIYSNRDDIAEVADIVIDLSELE